MEKIQKVALAVLAAGAIIIQTGAFTGFWDNAAGDKSSPLIDFVGSTTLVNSQKNGTELKLQHTIEKSDLVLFNISKIRAQIFSGEGIPVRIDGILYTMILEEMIVNDEGVNVDTHSYSGYLEECPVMRSIVLTTSERVIIARIHLNNEDYIVDSTSYENSGGDVYHFEYRSGDVRIEGDPLPAVQDYLAHADNYEGLDN
ncbi:MAG: hypothetical protein PHV39_03870 [Methanomicrobium sp.]|nr:hypothetical protein [Methanomicrobium sp.]